MIPIVKEPPELYEEFKLYDNCVFCNNPTDMWHWRTNNPVCPTCAKQHRVKELKKPKGYKVPTKEEFTKAFV